MCISNKALINIGIMIYFFVFKYEDRKLNKIQMYSTHKSAAIVYKHADVVILAI